MKLIEVNTMLRKKYNYTIIFMKYGNFYRCFFNAALVINYNFGYKITNNI